MNFVGVLNYVTHHEDISLRLIKHHDMKTYCGSGDTRYPWRCVEMCGQLHAPAALHRESVSLDAMPGIEDRSYSQ
jgi:hypothetical protein